MMISVCSLIKSGHWCNKFFILFQFCLMKMSLFCFLLLDFSTAAAVVPFSIILLCFLRR